MDSRFTSSYFRWSDASADEVLEDSEPEREERRQIRKASKLKERQLNQGRDKTSEDVVRNATMLLNPSSDLPSLLGDLAAEPSARQNIPIRHSATLTEPYVPLSSESHFGCLASPQSSNPSIAEEEPVQPKTFDLSRFAYSGGTRATKPSSTRAPSACSSVEELIPPRPRSRKSKKTAGETVIASDDPELGFALLLMLKCPLCSESWTTRKTEAGKTTHIKKCASKNGITTEAVRAAIKLAIADGASRPPPKSKGKAKAKQDAASVDDATPKTYLDNVVEGAAPKKRRRKIDATVTVQPPATTHNTILERAKTILADTQPSLDLRTPTTLSSTESDVVLLEDQDAPPLPTQPFPKSKLASVFRRPLVPSQSENQLPGLGNTAGEALAFFRRDESSTPGKVSPKRTFGSTPESLPLHPSRSLDASPSLNSRNVHPKVPPSIITISSDDESIASHPPAPSTSQTSPKQPISSGNNEVPQYEESIITDGSDGGWGDADSGCLVWDANHDTAQPDFKYLQQWESTSESESRAPAPLSRPSSNPPGPSTSNLSSAAQNPVTIKQKKPRAKKSRLKAVETSPAKTKLSDEELFNIFKHMIEEDEALYCRILRYEPVNMKTFVQKAEALGLQSPRLVKQLRTFLDAACIIHYDKT